MSSTLQVYILRGLPGAGKSTWAHRFVKTLSFGSGVIHNTDTYFTVNGVYRFDPAKVGVFHNLNYRAFERSMAKMIPWIVIDNTNTRDEDVIKYRDAAISSGYSVKIVQIGTFDDAGIELAVTRNLHRVPRHDIVRMAQRLESSLIDPDQIIKME